MPIPKDDPFLKAPLFEVRLLDNDKNLIQGHDNWFTHNKTSVYGLLRGGELWEVVTFLKNNMIYVYAPLE